MMLQRIHLKMYRRTCLFAFFVFLSFLSNCSEAQQTKSPAIEFRRHRVVYPVVQHGMTKRETANSECHHSPELTITLNLDEKGNTIDLVLSDDLLEANHPIVYYKNGSTVTYDTPFKDQSLCLYQGKMRDKKGSWVAVSTCHGVRGVFHDGKQMRYIEPAEENATIASKHFVYDHSDLTTTSHCGGNGGSNNTEYDLEHIKGNHSKHREEWSRSNRTRRDISEDTEVRSPFKVNKQSRFVELVLVADNAMYKASGENIHAVQRELKEIANIINSLYAPLNIFIALVGVEIWTEEDKIRLEDEGDITLANFLKYRREILNNQLPNDNAQLITYKRFNWGITVKFLKGTICISEYSGGVASKHSEVIGLVALSMAHGLGHNFGMEHDIENDCYCPEEKCIMNAAIGSVAPTRWSDCSLKSLALSFERGLDHCLRNKPKRLFDSPTCGNGFVEPGEQCDCGLRPDPACTACCHPTTCILANNATCASGECCDPLTCQPKSANTVCRSADHECDLPEYCTGHTEFCPKDVYKMDATPCSNDQAYCVQGSCRTHTDQCRLLWGSTGLNAAEKCYEHNIKGDRHGNCGYQRATIEHPMQIHRCAPEDVLCGLLHCKHLSERLEYGNEAASKLSALFINSNGSIIPCRTAVIDLGAQDVDPGMVPDGAKCGEDKMCLKQRCVSVSEVRQQIARQKSSECTSNCSGHGVCNSEGHCHCDAGFAPPLCALSGPGGSIDSGPAQYPTSIKCTFSIKGFECN